MTTDQIILFSLFFVVFAMLIWGRFRYDLVAFSALGAGVILGVVPAKDAFSGFGHPATAVVALVLVVSAGLTRSGVVLLITRKVTEQTRSLAAHIALMGGVGAVLSAFMNNVAALALLMPVDIQTAHKAGRSPSLSLMPLSFATILGGMATMIGTPPNIIIATIREDAVGESFAMFDFAPVGGLAAVVGLAFVALIGWRLIPDRGDATETVADVGDYLAELTVPNDSKLIGTVVDHLRPEAEKSDVAILGLVRNGKRVYGTASTYLLEAGDGLVLEAAPDALDEFRAAMNLSFADGAREEHLRADGDGLEMVEVVVPEMSRIAGKSAHLLGLAWRKKTVLMGIAREGQPIQHHVRRAIVRPGDILLLLIPRERVAEVTEWLGCLPLADRGLKVTMDSKMWFAIGLFAAAVAAAAMGLIYLPVALAVVVVGYVIAGIMPMEEIYDHVEWSVVLLLGSMIPLGAALETAGGTDLIASGLINLTEGWPAWAILTVLMVVTMTLSDVLNNTATTIVAAPVGIQMAASLGVSPDPFLMAVAVAASSAFLTPIGHKNNTLILGPGGYKFGDYWRVGLPLEVLIVAVSIPAIMTFWPF